METTAIVKDTVGILFHFFILSIICSESCGPGGAKLSPWHEMQLRKFPPPFREIAESNLLTVLGFRLANADSQYVMLRDTRNTGPTANIEHS